MKVLWPVLIQMVLVIVANTLIQWINPLVYNQLVYRFSQSLRAEVMEKVHRLPLSYLDKQGSGDFVSRLTTDVEQLNSGLLMVFNQFFVGLLTILVTIVTMAELDFFMMVAVLVLTLYPGDCSFLLPSVLYAFSKKQTKARGLQTQLIEESLTQESLIQSFNAQDQFREAFKGTNEKLCHYSQSAVFYSSTVNPATRFVNALIYAVVAGFVLRIISGSHFTVGQLVTFLNYVNQYTKPFNDISLSCQNSKVPLPAQSACIASWIKLRSKRQGQRVLESQDVKGAIGFEHVTFGYDLGRTLIKDLTIQVPAASKVAIVGAYWSRKNRP